MKKMILLAVLLATGMAMAAPGDSWILPIHHRDGSGWTEHVGAGYDGASAWSANTTDGTRRVYWEMSGAGIPAEVELYTIEFFAPTAGAGNWHPIESQIKGVDGETYPMEPLIPWEGAYDTNHQYIGSEFGEADRGNWKTTGPGPHTPASAEPDATPDGIYMWLKGGSWLYAKWDYGWAIDRSWSALRVTQVTPEPASALLLLLGLPLLRRKSR